LKLKKIKKKPFARAQARIEPVLVPKFKLFLFCLKFSFLFYED